MKKKAYYALLSHYYVGVCNHRHGNYEESLFHFNQGIEVFALLKDSAVLSDLYYQKSLIFRQQSDYRQFLENVNQSLRLAEAIDYKQNIGMCNNAKLIHFNERKEFETAEVCGKRALEIFESIADSSSLGDVYNNLGVMMTTRGDYDEALRFHLKQHELNLSLKNVWGQGYSYSKLASIYAKQGKKALAESHLKEALNITRKIGTPYELSGSLLKSARLNITLQNFSLAKQEACEAMDIAQEHNLLKSYGSGLSVLAEIYKGQGQLDSALFCMEELMSVNSTVLNESIGKELSELELKYDTEKKDNEILKLQLEDQLKAGRISKQRIIIISSILGLALLAYLFFRVRSKNEKIEEQNTIITKALKEKDVLLKEIHHRVKNNLQMISSLLAIQSRMVEDEKAKEAIQEGRTRVHSKSLIHQNLYQKDNLTGVPMQDYLPKLGQNLISTYNINASQISMRTEIDPIKLDVETVIPVGLIVNELITNAIKYAFPNQKKGEILILLKEQDNGELLLTVKDDGVGFSETQNETDETGFGHKLIGTFKNRLGADLSIINDNGTRIELEIRSFKKM